VDVPPRVLDALTSSLGRSAVASGNAGHILRVVRRALGLRQSELAARSGYSQATVSRAEHGRIRDATVIQDLADTLQIPASVFGGHAALGSDDPIRVDDVQRRDLLKAALAVASAAMLPAAVVVGDRGRRIGVGSVDGCRRALERVHTLEQQYGGAAVYDLTAGIAARLRATLGDATYGLSVGRKLRQVAADSMNRAGWQAYDAHRRDLARAWWLEALRVADLGDGVDEGRILALASLSREAADGTGRGNDAVGLARSATAVKSASPRMLSLLAAREGLGHAAAGNRAGTVAAMGRARRSLERGRSDDPAWLEFWGPGDLAIHEMHAARLCGDLAGAERAGREAVACVDARAMPRNHAIYAAHLGSSLARVGKFDEAISVSRDVLVGSVKNGSHRVQAELRQTARLLSASAYPPGRDFAATVERLARAG
jgi:transcriptional regulator with XRE-family HTH domain